ncbi:MAG: hypothetical protein FWC27_07565, partial [Firmicutes bacterium]|nr:hypothetical protein [Bacillota bacterium]
MAGKNKPSDVPPPQDDAIYRVKHISRSAWEEGALSLPGLTPRLTREEEPAFDDVAMDMAMTGEIPLELIRAMLRQQEGRLQAENQKRVKGPTGGGMIFPEEIVPAKAQATAEAPGPEEIERAKEELRAMKAKSRLPREDEAQEPRKPGGRKRPPRARGGEPPEAADEEEETGG